MSSQVFPRIEVLLISRMMVLNVRGTPGNRMSAVCCARRTSLTYRRSNVRFRTCLRAASACASPFSVSGTGAQPACVPVKFARLSP